MFSQRIDSTLTTTLSLLPTARAWITSTTRRKRAPIAPSFASPLKCPRQRRQHAECTPSLTRFSASTSSHASSHDEDLEATTTTNQTVTATTPAFRNDNVDKHQEEQDDDDDGLPLLRALTTTSLGDIMAADPSSSTKTTTLVEQYGIHHPLDRMALTANGNLQRLVSSYYDAPVQVVVDTCIRRRQGQGPKSHEQETVHVWDRVVHLTVYDTTFCTATSVITVRDVLCQALVESGQVGLGQLFRFLDLLPAFELHGAGKLVSWKEEASTTEEDPSSLRQPVFSGGGAFWRNYTLECPEVSCQIYEEFCPNMWELKPEEWQEL